MLEVLWSQLSHERVRNLPGHRRPFQQAQTGGISGGVGLMWKDLGAVNWAVKL